MSGFTLPNCVTNLTINPLPAASQSALIIGATGQTGRYVLQNLLASSQFTRVGEYGRRVTPKDDSITTGWDKLEQKVIDFEKLQESGLNQGNWDVVFITYVSCSLCPSPQVQSTGQARNDKGHCWKCGSL